MYSMLYILYEPNESPNRTILQLNALFTSSHASRSLFLTSRHGYRRLGMRTGPFSVLKWRFKGVISFWAPLLSCSWTVTVH